MADRAALVTGASSGIGLALAQMLGEEGHALTLVARRPDKLEAARERLAGQGFTVQAVSGNLADEETVVRSVAEHRDRYGRLDVLVNNAGIGLGAPVAELETKRVDLQLSVNIRSIVLSYRECHAMLVTAGAEHGSATVINLSSIAGKRGQGWLSVYSATKHAVVGFTEAMNQELNASGVKSVALCPAFVDTPMTDFIKGSVESQQMITVDDIATVARALLHLSPNCLVPEVIFQRVGAAV